ncbi:MAG: LLM class flavin-dependent oxidoreductase [Streptosporangiaceae bacterium]
MKRLEFGTHIDLEDPVASARQLESEGFDYINCGEHFLFHSSPQSRLKRVSSSWIALSAAAAVTSRIKLLSAIIQLPLYPTILVAKMATSLDILSQGRYNLGIGVAGEFAKEFEVTGVPVNERGARADEALEVIRRFWGEGLTSYQGRFHDFHDVSFQPKPVQSGGVPIWIAGRKDPAMRRAGRYGDVWFPYLYNPQMLHASVLKVRAAAVEAGRNPDAIRTAVLAYICLDKDPVKARRVATEVMGHVYQQDFERLVDRLILYGGPKQIRAGLSEFYDAGARQVMTFLVAPDAERSAMRKRFVAEVMPEFGVAGALPEVATREHVQERHQRDKGKHRPRQLRQTADVTAGGQVNPDEDHGDGMQEANQELENLLHPLNLPAAPWGPV